MAGGRQSERREVLRLRRAFAHAEQALAGLDRQLLVPHKLCASDLDILERLARKGTRPVNGLARRVGLTSGSMTSAVQRLRRRGLVQTRRDHEDKRIVFVSVTAEGKELAKRLSAGRAEVFGRVFGEWSERERSLLLNLLKRLRKSAESAKEGPDS
jgi:MarR family 2-MHQ and catechol resistance regulon transcriptional repressor